MQQPPHHRYLHLLIPLLLTLFTVGLAGASEERFGYKLGPRDVIATSIYAGGEQQVAVDLTVTEQGLINYPFLGPVHAGGLAVNELEEVLAAALEEDYFVDPQVHIQVKEYNSLHFSISGAIRSPGNYKMQSATTIMDLIVRAGGVTLDRGNIAYILRDSNTTETVTEPLRVNLQKLLNEGNTSHNVLLEPGDSIYIPLARGLDQGETKVYVSGQVVKPDLYEYLPGMTALSVCLQAGGFAKFASPKRTTVIRTEGGEQQMIKINLDQIASGKAEDFPLKPGDRLHVP